jgi:hypothetical protein
MFSGVAKSLMEWRNRLNKWILVLSIAASLLGGMISTYVRPQAANAQSQAPVEVRAQRFTLVNEKGVEMGSFSLDSAGRPQIVLRDRSGHDVWSVVGERGASYGRLHSK